jgi:hypothetical protein
MGRGIPPPPTGQPYIWRRWIERVVQGARLLKSEVVGVNPFATAPPARRYAMAVQWKLGFFVVR